MPRGSVPLPVLPPSTDQALQIPPGQVDMVLELLKPLVDAVGRTVGRFCEVVLHDLRVPEHSIVAISNGDVTGRKVGGTVIDGPTKDIALKLLDSGISTSTLSIGYRTYTRDHRELRSTSLVLRTTNGKPAVALCMNIDLSTLIVARHLLEEVTTVPASESEKAQEGPQTDVADVMTRIIQEVLAEAAKPPGFMDRGDRLQVVRLMHERGLFLIRGGVERAAAALGISRFTLYSYLKEVRVA